MTWKLIQGLFCCGGGEKNGNGFTKVKARLLSKEYWNNIHINHGYYIVVIEYKADSLVPVSSFNLGILSPTVTIKVFVCALFWKEQPETVFWRLSVPSASNAEEFGTMDRAGCFWARTMRTSFWSMWTRRYNAPSAPADCSSVTVRNRAFRKRWVRRCRFGLTAGPTACGPHGVGFPFRTESCDLLFRNRFFSLCGNCWRH